MKALYLIIISICVIMAQMSCYTQGKAGRQLSKAYNRYPFQVADSSEKWFPVIIVDSTIEQEYIEAFDSTEFYRQRYDSLQGVKQAEITVLDTIYKDTCRSAKETYRRGYATGYATGFSLGLHGCIPDTFLIRKTFTIESTAKVAAEKGRTAKAEKETGKWKARFRYVAGAAIIMLVLLLIGYILNRKK